MNSPGWMDPRVEAFDRAMELELLADQVVECRARLTSRGEVKVCRLPAGHRGVCEWAMTEAA